MERFYRIAGICIRVELPDDEPFSGDGPLAQFAAARSPWDHELIFQVVKELSVPKGRLIFTEAGKRIYSAETGFIRYDGCSPDSLESAFIRIHRENNRSTIQIRKQNIPAGITSNLILKAMEIDHLITQKGGVILHASYVILHGEAIVFTAPSGTGKSTQAALWHLFRGADIINGDRAILMSKDGTVTVHGLPFSGSSGICYNRSAPLKAVVYLSQASQNSLNILRGSASFRSIWEGCNLCRWDDRDMEIAASTVMTILNQKPVYHLACTADEEAVRTLEQALCQE